MPLNIDHTGPAQTIGTNASGITINGTLVTGGSTTGLAFFTENRITAAPNTVPVHTFQAVGAETNLNVSIVPKGTGAFSLQVPDGTVAGGNVRGANAIDLQTVRTAATQVASGVESVAIGSACQAVDGAVAIGARAVAPDNSQYPVLASGSTSLAIGYGALASGVRAVSIGNTELFDNGDGTFSPIRPQATGISSIAIGRGANATGFIATAIQAGSATADRAIAINGSATADSAIAIGTRGSATATGAICMAGSAAIRLPTASGAFSVAIGSNGNTASGTSSTIVGGNGATTNSIQALWAYGFDGVLNAGAGTGQHQMSFFGSRTITTDATTTRSTADAATASATNQLALRNNSVFKVEGRAVARDATTNDAKEWVFRALIKRGANAAATTLVGTPAITSEFADTAAATWALAVTTDTTNGALAINVTGQAAKTIRWTVVVWAQEVN